MTLTADGNMPPAAPHGCRGNKFWVAGAIQRDGQIRLEHVPNVRKNTLQDFIGRNVSPDAEAVYTDELRSYIGVGDTWEHRSVNHGCEQWVVGGVHTNSIEGVWSLFKRSLGSFHKVSLKHIDRYLSELAWRFNNRDNPRIFVDTLRRIVTTRRDAVCGVDLRCRLTNQAPALNAELNFTNGC